MHRQVPADERHLPQQPRNGRTSREPGHLPHLVTEKPWIWIKDDKRVGRAEVKGSKD